jgi:putative ABC transport system permease protein
MEGLLLGMLGACIGVALGCGLAWIISAIGIPMPPPPNSNHDYTAGIQLAPSGVGLAFFVGLAATVAASIPPALRVSRLPVSEALRRFI